MAHQLTRGALLLMALLGQSGCDAFIGMGPRAIAHFDDPSAVALAQAACDGDAEEVAERVSAGVPVSALGKSGITPLGFAVTCESLAGVRALLQAGADPNFPHRGDTTTTTWVAAGFDQPEVLAALLDAGGDMHATDMRGNTVLVRAFTLGAQVLDGSAWGNYELLLARGVDLNQANEMGRTIANQVTVFARFDKMIDLLERGYSYDLLSVAWATENRAFSEEKRPDVERVKAMLRERGVKWPIPAPLNNENRRAYMLAHPEYAAKHPESGPREYSETP